MGHLAEPKKGWIIFLLCPWQPPPQNKHMHKHTVYTFTHKQTLLVNNVCDQGIQAEPHRLPSNHQHTQKKKTNTQTHHTHTNTQAHTHIYIYTQTENELSILVPDSPPMHIVHTQRHELKHRYKNTHTLVHFWGSLRFPWNGYEEEWHVLQTLTRLGLGFYLAWPWHANILL